jgi:hypothetical protein
MFSRFSFLVPRFQSPDGECLVRGSTSCISRSQSPDWECLVRGSTSFSFPVSRLGMSC